MAITPAKNLWHCFGCGLGGGVIDWMMKADGVGVSFRHAVELLRAGLPAFAAETGLGSASDPVKRSTVRTSFGLAGEYRSRITLQLVGSLTTYVVWTRR